MTGYTRKDTANNISDGSIINADDLDNEFDGVQAAFHASTGHTHDGTAAEGAAITKVGPVQDVLITTSAIYPKTTNTVDLGTSSLKYKDAFIAGNETVGGTLAVTGVTTLTAQPVLSSLTASQAVFTDASKGLVSNAITGTGNVVMSASPTLTGTIGGASATLSGTLAVTGVATLTAQPILSSLTASSAVATDASKGLVSVTNTGTGNNVLATSPTLVTPVLGAATGTSLILSASTTTDALRVTQTGAGNAFVVEDNVNPDASPFVIDAVGTVLAGFSTAPAGSYKAYISGSAFATSAWRVGDSTDGSVSGYISNVSNTSKSIQIAADPDNLGANSLITFNIDGSEKARFSSTGNLLIGTATGSAAGIRNTWNPTGGTTAYGILVNGTIQSDVTSAVNLLGTIANTAAATFNLTNLRHFAATANPFGAGSTVTNQYGFFAASDLSAATNNYGFYSAIASGTGDWNFYAAGTADNYFAGNVGIGTTSPGTKLDIQGSVPFARVKESSTGYLGFRAENNSGNFYFGVDSSTGGFYGSAYARVLYSDGAYPMVFYTNATERMRLDSAGNLGLGVTPSAWGDYRAFQIGFGASIASAADTSVVVSSNAYNSNASGWKYRTTNSSAQYEQFNGGHYWFTAPSGTAGNAITFTQAMTLDASGNLGIGLTSPDMKVHAYNTASNTWFRAQSGGDNSTGLYMTNSQRSWLWGVSGGGAGSMYLYDLTGSKQVMNIDSAGNLGLGVTPSAWGAGWKAFEVGPNAASAFIMGGGDDSIFGNSCRTTNGSAWYYTYTSVAPTKFRQQSGRFEWYTAPAGTAGNAITFTQAMTLDASGNLLVGQTSNGAQNANSMYFNPTTGYGANLVISHLSGTPSSREYQQYLYNGTAIGSITQNGTTAVAYNTNSDYRLKNITGPITTSGAYIDSLKPVEGTWKADGSTFVGLIAHETQEVSRTTVATGTKDGEQMQGMDYSSAEIIANLIAELQSVRIRLAALEAK